MGMENYYRKILTKDKKLLIKSSLTSFKTLEPSYSWTNEDMFCYPKLDLKNDSIFSVTSSGDHNMYLILNGATKIDSYDVNYFSKFISSLKIAVMKNYHYEDFNYIFSSFFSTGSLIIDGEDVLKKIEVDLEDWNIIFWRVYQELLSNNVISQRDVIYNTGNFYNNVYSCYDYYNEIRRRLNSVQINYVDFDINKISSLDNEYGYILISNILQYVLNSSKKQEVEVYQILIENLFKSLKKDGMILGYNFYGGDAYKNALPKGISYRKITSKRNQSESVFMLEKI